MKRGEKRRPALVRYVLSLALLSAGLLASPVAADEWLVYVGGGIEPIHGAWTEREADVTFTQRNGTLVSVPYEDVDLATSAFITWQLNGRRQAPPRQDLPPVGPDGDSNELGGQCTRARVIAFSGGETFDVQYGDVRERVHAACLDAPEVEHRFVELGWFGRAMVSAVRLEFGLGDEVCFSEQSPPVADEEGHRVVHISLPGGQDYSREVIAGGLGLLRPTRCDRAVEYRGLEDRAIAQQRGLWGAWGTRPAIVAASRVASTGPGAGGAAAARPGAAPKRRTGGG